MPDSGKVQNPSPFTWVRDPNHRFIFSNFFNFRFGSGDGSIAFSQFTDSIGSPAMNQIHEHITISMSWPQLKLLGEYINVAVEEMEKHTGPLPTPESFSRERLRTQSAAIIKGFQIKKAT